MACACQSVNDVGEPCAGEPHARFDAAAGGNPNQSAMPREQASLPPTLQLTASSGPATKGGGGAH